MPIGYPFDGQYDGIRNRLGMGKSSVAGLRASAYDGTNDYQLIETDMTGNADGKKYLVSLFVQFEGTEPGENQSIFETRNFTFAVRKRASKLIEVQGRNTVLEDVLLHRSIDTVEIDGQWHHVLASGDLGVSGSERLYVDDTPAGLPITLIDDFIDFTRTEHAIGATVFGSRKMHGRLSELYFNYAEFLDLSVEANRRKFTSASGKPVFLGVNGELPTGTAPIVYAPNGDATQNFGTGGDYMTVGSLDLLTGPGV